VRSDSNLNKQFAAEGADTRQYGSMPGVLDTNTVVSGRGKVLRSHAFSGNETDSVFYNVGGAKFADVSGVSGMDSVADGRGFSYFDYDRDGWEDVVLVNSNAPQLELFRNRIGDSLKDAHSIRVRLQGGNATAQPTAGTAPREGYGAHVLLRVGGKEVLRELRCGDGFAAQNSATLLIGIGNAAAADEVRVRWPSGKITSVGRVPADVTVTVAETPTAGASAFVIETLPPAKPPARAVPGIPLAHLEVPLPSDGAKLRVFTMMATWCPVCREELPHLALIKRGLTGTDVVLYGVPVDGNDTTDMLKDYTAKHSPAYQILADLPESGREKFRSLTRARFGETPLPSTIVTSGSGDVILVKKGTLDLSAVRGLLKQLSPVNP
jgi:hypothetical protein